MIVQQSKTNKIKLIIRIITVSVIIISLWMIFTQKNYYQMSVAELTKYARQNDPNAQFVLGYRYSMGLGVKEDPATAFNLYQKAAQQGNAMAMCNLGRLYATGRGVEKNFDKAREWYQKAVELKPDDPNALYSLGWAYMQQEDYAKARHFYQQAAKQGSLEAQHAIAWLLNKGLGGNQDKARSIELYLNAAAKGNGNAMMSLGRAYLTGDGIDKNVAKGLEWYQKAAGAGEATAQGYLGLVYIRGETGGYVVGRNYEKALGYIRQGVEQQDKQSQYLMGWLYHRGQGLRQDFSQAMEWYQKAAAQDMPDAINGIGHLYEYGQGVIADKNEAIKWYRRAAALNNKAAKENLERLRRQ